MADAWALSLTRASESWSQLSPAGAAPAARFGHAAIYDPAGQRMILFSGVGDGLAFFNDVWSLELDATPAWAAVSPSRTGPVPTLSPATTCDPAANRMVVFGGSENNQTWALALGAQPAWTQLDPGGSGAPSNGSVSDIILEATRDRVVAFGYESPSDRVWALGLSGAPAWSGLSPDGGPPGIQYGYAVLDPSGPRMIVLGKTPVGAFQVWALGLDHPTPVLATPLETEAAWDRVPLAWAVTGAPAAEVERRREDGPWRFVGAASPAGPDRLRFEDTAVEPGGRYAYRLRFAGEPEPAASSEVMVTVPFRGPVLAIRPNPSAGEFTVEVDLGAGVPVRLEILDLAGRRIESRAAITDRHGRQTLSLGSRGAPAPGLYRLRLRGGGHEATARIAVIR